MDGSVDTQSDNDGEENADGNDEDNAELLFALIILPILALIFCSTFSSNGVPSSDSYVIRISVWARLLKLDRPDEDDDELLDGVGDLDPAKKHVETRNNAGTVEQEEDDDELDSDEELDDVGVGKLLVEVLIAADDGDGGNSVIFYQSIK